MKYNINFQKAKRNYMTLTFDDEREVLREGEKTIEEYERTICVGMPKKRTFSKLMDMQELIDKMEDAQTKVEKNQANRDIIDGLYDLTAEILSNNKKGENIAVEWVEEQFTVENLKEFLTQYIKFTNGEATDPN